MLHVQIRGLYALILFKPVIIIILLIWLMFMTWITLSIVVMPGGTDIQNVLKSVVTLTAESVTFSGSRDSRVKVNIVFFTVSGLISGAPVDNTSLKP